MSGKAGSGKTLLACQVALDGLFRRQYEKIIITRPTVSKEDIGFLPGDIKEKMEIIFGGTKMGFLFQLKTKKNFPKTRKKFFML